MNSDPSPSRKNARNTRGRPFEPGNPGRPKGARNRATLAARTLLEGEAEALSRKAVELALAGDIAALRLCLERILPPQRERLLQYPTGPISDLGEALSAIGNAIEAIGRGDLTPSEAASIIRSAESYIRAFQATESDRRFPQF